MIEERQGAIKLRDLAKSLNLSVSHLSNLFRATLGMSPTRFIKEVRQTHAIRLLQETSLSIKEVAARVGFRDKSHFNREFRKHCGSTPRELRSAYLASRKSKGAASA